MANLRSKSSKSNKGFLSTNVFLALLGICLVSVSAILWKTQESRNLSQIGSSTESKARSYSSETEIRYNSIYKALDRLASRGGPREEADIDEWKQDAAFYIDAFPGIKRIAWVDETFRIRQIVPTQDNASYVNRKASEMKEDPSDLNLWVPSYDGTEFIGYILGTMNIDSFMSPVVREIGNDYMLQLSSEGMTIFKSENWSHPREGSVVEKTITLENATVLRLAFAPTEELLHSGAVNAWKTLLFGLFFSFIAIVAVYFAQNFNAIAILNESRYRNLFEASRDAIFITNLKGEYRDANPAATEMVGYSLTELQHMTVDDLQAQTETLPHDVHSRMWTEGGTIEISLRHKDGHTIPVELAISPIREGEVQKHVLGIARDITDRARIEAIRAQAEEALKEHSERLEEMVEERTAELRGSEAKSRAQYKGIPIPTYTWQKREGDLILVDYNDAAEAITQGRIADFVGIRLENMYADTPEIREEIARCFAEKTTIEREMSYRFRSTGEERHLAVKYAFVPPNLVLVHTEDITERILAEEEAKRNMVELKRMVNMMAGREVRMAELKGVIRKLRAQLEEEGLEPAADDPLLGS